VRVYFTLGRSPVEANSVAIRIWVVHAWLDVSLEREQARRERESELRLVTSL